MKLSVIALLIAFFAVGTLSAAPQAEEGQPESEQCQVAPAAPEAAPDSDETNVPADHWPPRHHGVWHCTAYPNGHGHSHGHSAYDRSYWRAYHRALWDCQRWHGRCHVHCHFDHFHR